MDITRTLKVRVIAEIANHHLIRRHPTSSIKIGPYWSDFSLYAFDNKHMLQYRQTLTLAKQQIFFSCVSLLFQLGTQLVFPLLHHLS